MPDAYDLMERGLNALDAKHYREAIDIYTRYLQDDPRNDVALMCRAMAHIGVMDRPRAIADVSAAISIEPDNITYLDLRSAYYMLQKQYDEALADLDRVHKLDPNFATLPGKRAVRRMHSGNTAAALSELERAVNVDPENAESYRTMRQGILNSLVSAHEMAREFGV